MHTPGAELTAPGVNADIPRFPAEENADDLTDGYILCGRNGPVHPVI